MQESPARPDVRGEIDWRLFAPLLVHVVLVNMAFGVIRVTISYRTIELGLPAVWLGVISAGFAILPIFLAVTIGRFIDRGHDAHAAWIGSTMMLVAAFCLWAWPLSAAHLLLFTILLGTGHMFLMASQQMLTVRSATPAGRESSFGNFMVAISLGQGLGPYLVGWIGGAVTVPETGPLFLVGLIGSVLCLIVAFVLRPAPRGQDREAHRKTVPLGALLRLPGMLAMLMASVVTVTSGDLLVIYLPLLGAERNIDASHIGMLLLVRSIAGLVSRLFYARLVFEVGRLRLALISTCIAAAAFVLLMVPMLPVMYVAAVAVGAGLGIALTLTISGVVEVAPPEARGTAMTLRITGNRIGLMCMPLAAGFVAAATGAGGILAIIALSLTGSAVAMQRSARGPSI
jgi:predicted MFS family arabinose efflux permease